MAGETRWSRRVLSVQELSGLGEGHERDAAIVALFIGQAWDAGRIAGVFDITSRRVRQIVQEFREHVLGESD